MTYVCVLGPNKNKNKVMRHLAAELKVGLVAAEDLRGPYRCFPSKIPIFYGIGGFNFDAIQFYREVNCDFFILDNAWTTTEGEVRLRMHKNSFSYQHANCNIPKAEIDVVPGSKFLVLPPSGPRALFDNAVAWHANILTQLSCAKMTYTSKPKLSSASWNYSACHGMKLSSALTRFQTRFQNFGWGTPKKAKKNPAIQEEIQKSDVVIAYNSSLILECIKLGVPFMAGIGAPFGALKNKDFLNVDFSRASVIESYDAVLEYIQKVEFNVSQFSTKTMKVISNLHENVMSPRDYDPRY